MPRRMIFQVYVGEPSTLYDYCTQSVHEYATTHGCDHVILRDPILRIRPNPATNERSTGALRMGYLPIFEKENAFAELDKYDQVAIVDADVYIKPGASNIFEKVPPNRDFGAVRERSLPITDEYRNKLRGYSSMCFAPLSDVDWDCRDGVADFFNMGVLVLNKRIQRLLRGETPAEFLARPEFQRFIDGVGGWRWSTDQVLLNYWLRSRPIADGVALDWRFNALFGAIAPDMRPQAHFLHFFLRDHLPDRGENVAQIVKETFG